MSIINQCRALVTVQRKDLEYMLGHPFDPTFIARLADHITDFSLAGIRAVGAAAYPKWLKQERTTPAGRHLGPLISGRSVLFAGKKGRILFGIILFQATRTNTMAELGFRVRMDIFFQLIPQSFAIAYLLAMGAYRYDAAQGLDFIENLLKFVFFTHQQFFGFYNDIRSEKSDRHGQQNTGYR